MQMQVKVLYFASVRELTGRDFQEIKLSQPSKEEDDIFVETADSILEKVLEQVKSCECEFEPLEELINRSMLAVDNEYCMDRGQEIKLSAKSEIAIIPPISGG